MWLFGAVAVAVIDQQQGGGCQSQGAGYQALLGVSDRHIRREVNRDEYDRIEALGRDEIALKKGHRDQTTVDDGQRDGSVCWPCYRIGKKRR